MTARLGRTTSPRLPALLAIVVASGMGCGSPPPDRASNAPPVVRSSQVPPAQPSAVVAVTSPTIAPTAAAPSSKPAAPESTAAESMVSGAARSVMDRAWEPIVATDPTDANSIAVVYQHRGPGTACSLNPTIRISADGGRTWRSTKGHPGAGSGRGLSLHAAIAWGPGPAGGRRLYWTNMTVPGCAYGAFSLSTSWSDDRGTTWSKLRVERRTPPWVGGFPEIAVDRNEASPNYGVVYVAYNWLPPRASAPGFRLLASPDFGRTWMPLEIPVAKGPRGYPDSWRIGYRLVTAPDGSVYASWYQVDLRRWDRVRIFAKGGAGNVGRLGVAIARIRFDRSKRTFSVGPSTIAATVRETAYTTSGASAPGTAGNIRPDPMWLHGIDVDPQSGRIYLAVAGYGPAAPGASRGTIRVARSDDAGRTWKFTTVPSLPPVNGRRQSSIKPNLVVAAGGSVVVTFHSLDDTMANATIGNAYAVSTDAGVTWGTPVAVSGVRWRAANLGGVVNGAGLRERATRLANGDVYWVYGDGRRATGAAAGRTVIYGSAIRIRPG